MTKNERIAELERKVAELEAAAFSRKFYEGPFSLGRTDSAAPMGRCMGCGTALNDIAPHLCHLPSFTQGGSTTAAPSYLPTNIYNIGAAS